MGGLGDQLGLVVTQSLQTRSPTAVFIISEAWLRSVWLHSACGAANSFQWGAPLMGNAYNKVADPPPPLFFGYAGGGGR